jgi:hypothetical protein
MCVHSRPGDTWSRCHRARNCPSSCKEFAKYKSTASKNSRLGRHGRWQVHRFEHWYIEADYPPKCLHERCGHRKHFERFLRSARPCWIITPSSCSCISIPVWEQSFVPILAIEPKWIPWAGFSWIMPPGQVRKIVLFSAYFFLICCRLNSPYLPSQAFRYRPLLQDLAQGGKGYLNSTEVTALTLNKPGCYNIVLNNLDAGIDHPLHLRKLTKLFSSYLYHGGW